MDNQTIAMEPCPNPWCEADEREGDFRPQVQYSNFGMVYVACTSCNMAGPTRQHETEAIAAWNTRTPAPAPASVSGDVVERATIEASRLSHELDITNADHIALWLERNTIPDEPMSQCTSWLACRIVEAHEAALAAMQQAPVKLDWRAIAKAAGEHGVRYRTNSALMAFFAQIGLTQPQAYAAEAVERDRLLAAVRELADVCGDWNGISDETNAIYEEAIRAGGQP